MYVATAIASKVSISATLGDSKPCSKLSYGFFNSHIHTFPCSDLPKSLLYIQQHCFISMIHLYSDQYEVFVILRKKKTIFTGLFQQFCLDFQTIKLGVFCTYCWLVSMTTKLILLGLLLLVSTIPRGSVTCHFSSQSNCWWQFVLSVWFYCIFISEPAENVRNIRIKLLSLSWSSNYECIKQQFASVSRGCAWLISKFHDILLEKERRGAEDLLLSDSVSGWNAVRLLIERPPLSDKSRVECSVTVTEISVLTVSTRWSGQIQVTETGDRKSVV